ncbi:hypothetical protein Noc_0782 [Nitrosococcus oceani ATCC 19707]|uniref:Uncharacterized protein n=4 Tax=Nitrosococcus oceani TaxID=1229 RepID=Q3JD01_NITOC|nr:hypothetical protein Noc_0782 [Nitrosococcus oceani ATCC 19707]EDZ67891.1 hypothetical protein NOC27_1218 [Nitrosococcus oceani AFC27]KFI20271.1 hypothetical protein IB75_03945 [Nitrosococcus oceani C-27]
MKLSASPSIIKQPLAADDDYEKALEPIAASSGMAKFNRARTVIISMRIPTNVTARLSLALMAFFLITLPIWAGKPPPFIPELVSDSPTASAGFYHLKWQGSDLSALAYELQEANDMEFTQPTTIYRGPDQGTLISGQNNGHYFYRVRTLKQGQSTSSWSSPLVVTVQHHSLARAFAFFSAGATVLFATLALIISGAWRSQKEDS